MPRIISVRVGRQPSAPAGPLTVGQFQAAMARRFVLGHQSVGAQVLTGIGEHATALGQPDPVEIAIGTDSIPGSGGFVGDFFVGVNGDGLGKVTAFDTLMRGGLANQIDTGCLKFCYADLRSGSGYTPQDLFDSYSVMMIDLAVDYPSVKWLWATETIVCEDDEDGPNNGLRMTFNQLVRAAAPAGRLWDLALAESTDPSGNRIIVNGIEHLYGTYASADREHIGTPGGRMAASKPLLQLMATL